MAEVNVTIILNDIKTNEKMWGKELYTIFSLLLTINTCVSAVSTLIRWVEMNRSTSVIG